MAKILIVEDDVTTQKLVLAILERNGHCGFVSPNGRHALESLQVNKFDLMITDVMMPELDGRGLIEAVRRTPHLDEISIIMSAVIKASDVADLLESGASYFIAKPLDKADLLEYVDLSLADKACREKRKTRKKQGNK
jgi:CheY-like chemotaxis protein